MSATLIALVEFAAWTGLLVFGLANLRIAISARTKKPLNSYSPSGDDLEGLGQRWTRKDRRLLCAGKFGKQKKQAD